MRLAGRNRGEIRVTPDGITGSSGMNLETVHGSADQPLREGLGEKSVPLARLHS